MEPPLQTRANCVALLTDIGVERLRLPSLPTRTADENLRTLHDYQKLTYALTLLHASLQERRKFGSLGFNCPYSFTSADLHCSLRQLEEQMAQPGRLSYEVVRHLVAQINYGGRVTDEWDRRCLDALTATFIRPEVVIPLMM